jgi:RES domain
MSDNASLDPAPTDRDFSIVPELAQYVVTTRRKLVWRVHGHDGSTGKPYHPVYFSNSESSRWDFRSQPSGTAVVNVDGVICVGASFTGALIEVFDKRWPSLLPPRSGSLAAYSNRRALTQSDITLKYATRLFLPSGLRLFDLTSPGALSSVGADGALTTTKDYRSTREWARWFFQCEQVDGLIYSSRPGGARLINYVLFNRPGVQAALSKTAGKTRPLKSWVLKLAQACKNLNVVVLSSPTPAGP